MADIYSYDPFSVGKSAVPDIAGIFDHVQEVQAYQQQQRAKQAAIDLKAQQDADYQRQVEHLIADPSPDNSFAFALRNPKVANEVKAANEMKDAQTKSNDFRDSSNLYTMALGGAHGDVADKFDERFKVTGDKNAQRLATLMRSDRPGDRQEAMAEMGVHIASISDDPTKVLEAYKQYYLPKYEQVGDYYVDQNTGKVFQSGYGKVVSGPGGFWPYGARPGMDVFGGGGVDAGAMQGAPGAAQTPGGPAPAATIPGSLDMTNPDQVWGGMKMGESGGQHFDPSGKVKRSSKGALGLAQVMPATGPEAAKLAGEPWDLKRLASDPAYNERLGRAYYNKQLKDFGSPLEAAAAYNAGPGKMRQALRKGGRSGWINHVPNETRDYVMRLAGGPQQLNEARVKADAAAAIAAGANPAAVAAAAKLMGVVI